MGTWAHPNTVDKAQQLLKLMDKPIRADRAEGLLWDLIGDDHFMDLVEVERREDPAQDIRPLVIVIMAKWIKTDTWYVEIPADILVLWEKVLVDIT